MRGSPSQHLPEPLDDLQLWTVTGYRPVGGADQWRRRRKNPEEEGRQQDEIRLSVLRSERMGQAGYQGDLRRVRGRTGSGKPGRLTGVRPTGHRHFWRWRIPAPPEMAVGSASGEVWPASHLTGVMVVVHNPQRHRAPARRGAHVPKSSRTPAEFARRSASTWDRGSTHRRAV